MELAADAFAGLGEQICLLILMLVRKFEVVLGVLFELLLSSVRETLHFCWFQTSLDLALDYQHGFSVQFCGIMTGEVSVATLMSTPTILNDFISENLLPCWLGKGGGLPAGRRGVSSSSR